MKTWQREDRGLDGAGGKAVKEIGGEEIMKGWSPLSENLIAWDSL